MGIQFSDWVENIVGKEEIACYEQFLLFPQSFQKLTVVDAWNEYLWSKGLMTLRKMPFENVTSFSTFYAPALIDRPVRLFVCKNLYTDHGFWMVYDRAFISNTYSLVVQPFLLYQAKVIC